MERFFWALGSSKLNQQCLAARIGMSCATLPRSLRVLWGSCSHCGAQKLEQSELTSTLTAGSGDGVHDADRTASLRSDHCAVYTIDRQINGFIYIHTHTHSTVILQEGFSTSYFIFLITLNQVSLLPAAVHLCKAIMLGCVGMLHARVQQSPLQEL